MNDIQKLLYSRADLARLLDITPGCLRSRAYRARQIGQEPYPRVTLLPGSQRPYYSPDAIAEWLSNHTAPADAEQTLLQPLPRRGGRPRKGTTT